MKDFLAFDKISWEETDYMDGSHYRTLIYPAEDKTFVETLVYKNGWKQQSSNEIDTDGIFEQINDAIKRQKESGEKIIGYGASSLKGHYTGKPTKKCENAYKKMVGEIPNFKKNMKRII